jgi:endonuclease YncB( thermonuclease family)
VVSLPATTPLPSISPATASAGSPDGERAIATHVYDGDTIDVELDGRTYRLRYIGVDSPEREEPFYDEALAFNRDLVEDRTVILVRDVSETDQYGRLLRYVYLEDGTFVNGELIARGMARLVTFPPDVVQTDYLRVLQDQAREAGAGMWGRLDLVGPCDCDRNLYDCRDFRSREESQTCFDYCRETTGRDVHNLDGGGDGLVCEFLP